MADAASTHRGISAQSVEVSRVIYSVYTRDIAHANATQIAATMHETSRSDNGA